MKEAGGSPEVTRWSMVLAGRSRDSSRYEEAWGYLFATYHGAIQKFFKRCTGNVTLAEDLTDEFIARWVEGKLDGADPGRGRFRPYLYRCLRNFQINHYKQVGRKTLWRRVLSLGRDSAGAELPDPTIQAPLEDLERDCFLRLLELALGKLLKHQQHQIEVGQPNHSHDLLMAYYVEPDAAGVRPTHQQLAEQFGLSAKAVERQLSAAREKLRSWITFELLQCVGSESELPG